MNIAVGSDHRGRELRARVVELLRQLGHGVQDLGAWGQEPVDYPDVAAAVAEAVAGGDCQRGILICGTGIGMSVAANKVPGIIAAACHDDMTAEMSRRHNNANVLCLSAEALGPGLVNRIISIWLATDFEGGRHQRRVDKIRALEQKPTLAKPGGKDL